MSTLFFEIGGIEIKDRDASTSFTTDRIEFKWSHRWSVQFVDNSTGGSPIYTVEISIDGTQWDAWDITATNIPIDDPYFDEIMPFRFLRVVYDGGASGGTLSLLYRITNDKFV